jgi:hypothetical protein
MVRSVPDFFTRVHIAPAVHYSVKESSVLLQDSVTYSTSESGEKEIYSFQVNEGIILFVTDVVVSSTANITVKLCKKVDTEQIVLCPFLLPSNSTIVQHRVTPLKIVGGTNVYFSVICTFPSGGGTVYFSFSGWNEKILYNVGYYDLSTYGEAVYG